MGTEFPFQFFHASDCRLGAATSDRANADDDRGASSSPAEDTGAQIPVSLEEERAKRWQDNLLRTRGRTGAPKKILANALVALRYAPVWKNSLRFNAFATSIILDRAPPWTRSKTWQPREWTDHDNLKLTEWLQIQNIDVSKNIAGDAAFTIAKEREFHPVRDYFATLEWDRKPRLDRWLIDYLGSPDRPYEKTIGARWWISMVARVMRPGCKADCVLILIGNQGQGKSTALEIIAGKEWFTDEIGALHGNKDTPIAMAGKLLVEFSDLEGFHGRSADELKAFLSRTTDRFRPHYGRYAEDHPRQIAFAGTTNQRTPLKDFTGNRRFWPTETQSVHLEALRRDRDQLWAEAVTRFSAGEPWWLDTPDLRSLADEVAEERRDADELEAEIAEFLQGKDQITMRELLRKLCDKSPMETTRAEQTRIGSALHVLGWEKTNRLRTSGAREWLYTRRVSKS